MGTVNASPGTPPHARYSAASAPSAEPHGVDPEAAETPSKLNARILQLRRTTLAAVPTWALVLMALLLAAGTAYAAYRAVTAWVLPALEQALEPDVEEDLEDEEAAEAEEAEDAEGLTDEETMYRLYYEKCQEYIALYGEPGVMHEEYTSSYTGTTTFEDTAYGLAGILLVDFDGDGTEELLLAYCTISDLVKAEGQGGLRDTADYTDDYYVEIWRYDAGTLVCAYSDKACSADGNNTNFSFVLYSYEGRLCIYTSYVGDSDDGGYTISYLWSAMGEDGTFEVLLSQSYATDDRSVWNDVYTVNGAAATADEYYAAYEELSLVQRYRLFSYDDYSSDDTQTGTEDLIALSQETLEQLASYQEG